MSYRNPVTYVDSQSGKYFASAIQNISNTTAGVIDTLGAKAEAERKKKEEENFKLLNDVTKYNLDYLNNANLASKDFDLQPALQPALSGLVDQGSRIKAQLLNSKNPAERAQLQSQLAQYETFFKGGGMKNLLESFQQKRELFSKLGVTGKAGSEGGIDMKKLDPKLAKFFMSTYNDTLPSDLAINIVNNNGVFDIVLNSTGGQFGKKGSYQQSLMALMSADLPTIPGMTSESENALFEGQIVDAKTRRVTAKGMATYLKGSGRKDVGSNTFEFYEFSDEGRKLFRNDMRANILSTLAGYSNEGSLMDGPGSGFNAIESYYNNVLRQKGDLDLKIGSAEGTSLDPESLDRVIKYMTNNLEKTFEEGINPGLLQKPSNPNSTTTYDPSVKGKKIIARIKTDPEKFTREILDFDSQEDITVEGKSKTSNGILKITTDTVDPDTEEIVEEVQSYDLDDPSDIRRYVRKLAEYDKSYSTGNDKGKSVLDYLLTEAENIKGFVESKVNNKEKMENLKAVPVVIENLSNIENFDTLTNRAGKVVASRNRRSKERKAYAEAKSIIEKQLETITQEELEKQISDASADADADGKDELVISLQKKLNLIRNITGINLTGNLYKKDK